MDRREFLKKATNSGIMAGLAVTKLDKVSAAVEKVSRVKKGEYKKAVTLSMLSPGKTIEEQFKLARDCGFDGIEIPPMNDPQQVELVQKAIEATGVPAHSIIFGGWDKPLSHPDSAVADEGLKAVADGLRFAKSVGADGLLLVPAVVNKNTRYVEAYERSQKRIRTLIPLATELEVSVNVEEVWNKFLLSPLEFARYIDEFKSPWVQAYFDIANVIDFAWPEDWIRTLGPRIKKIHVKDFKRADRSWPALGDGDADFPVVMRALKEVGYSGWLTCELPGGDKEYLLGVSRRLDKIIQGQNPAA